MNMKEKQKKYNKLIYLLNKYTCFPSIYQFDNNSDWFNHKEKKEIFKLFKEFGYDKNSAIDLWMNVDCQKYHRQSYKTMPKLPKQDNKTYKSTGHSSHTSNACKIRYPKKCRKTAWKRFYKLFPELKPDKL